jgi:hypothetical protein
MIIHWLIPGNYKSSEDLANSNLASIRMRAGLVGLYANDIQVSFTAGDYINYNADVIVVGKIGVEGLAWRSKLWLEQLSSAKKLSKIIVIDYTDHHLGSLASPMFAFYTNILPLINKAVVSSKLLSHLLAQFLDKEIIVIEDPIEIQITPPKNSTFIDELTLLWFGHSTNLSYLFNYLQNSYCDENFRLIVLSNVPGLKIFASQKKRIRPSIKLVLAEWSLRNMIEASKLCQGCLIPSDFNDSKKSGASSNRLITAFALGLPVSADILESYSPFADYFHNIQDTPLSEFNKQLALYSKKIELAQENIVPMFRQEVLAQKWSKFFLTTIQS